MAVDYLSALNAGSGLNTTQIVDALVEASRAPKEKQSTKKSKKIMSKFQVLEHLNNNLKLLKMP